MASGSTHLPRGQTWPAMTGVGHGRHKFIQSLYKVWAKLQSWDNVYAKVIVRFCIHRVWFTDLFRVFVFAHEIHPMSLCLWTFSHVFPIDRDVRFLCLVESRLLALRAWGQVWTIYIFMYLWGRLPWEVAGGRESAKSFRCTRCQRIKGSVPPFCYLCLCYVVCLYDISYSAKTACVTVQS